VQTNIQEEIDELQKYVDGLPPEFQNDLLGQTYKERLRLLKLEAAGQLPEQTCSRCGEAKTSGVCKGDGGSCPGAPTERVCAGWTEYCCLCGETYAKGQL
jgi:hypothetical protein